MNGQWHYSQDGAQYGPVDEAEIIRLIQDGELAPGTPVLKVGSMDWQPARNHACFQVEIFPRKIWPSVQAAPTVPKVTTPKPAQKTQSPSVTTCDDCHEKISVHADACPHCGSPAKFALRSWSGGASSKQAKAKPAATTPSSKTSQSARHTTSPFAAPPIAMGTVCPQCNATVQSGQSVCMNCGSHLQAVPSARKVGAGKLIAIVCGVLFGGLFIVGILASMLLPSLAKAKNKANRIKYRNNLSTIGKAFQDFSGEIDGSTPHLYGAFVGNDGDNLARALGYQDANDPYKCQQWCNAYTIRMNLNGYATLASPLDQAAIAHQCRNMVKTFDEYRERTDLSHDPKQMSYAIAMQGDVKAPETVLALTRNIRSADDAMRRAHIRQWGGQNDSEIWKYPNIDRPWSNYGGFQCNIRGAGNKSYDSGFLGPDDEKYGMTGLDEAQANWLLAGGSVASGSESEFNDQLQRAEENFQEGDAIAPGLNLTVLRPQQ